jgi:diguanylate cyclase (GGDEF)-like protein
MAAGLAARKMNSCLEIRSEKPFAPTMLDVIHGIFHVYCNYQSLLDYSERDALTGLFNRKTFDEQFTRYAFAIAPHEAHSLDHDERRHDSNDEPKGHWLAVVDIDHFKQVNDRYGHLYGDEVLILVANILRASFRAHDRIFRFGGEEFVILLRSTTLTDARKIFDRFRQNVQEYDFPQVGKVTVSLGFVNIARETPVVILGTRTRRCITPRRAAATASAITRNWSIRACCARTSPPTIRWNSFSLTRRLSSAKDRASGLFSPAFFGTPCKAHGERLSSCMPCIRSCFKSMRHRRAAFV